MTRRKQTMDMDMFEKVISHYEMMGGGDLALTPSVGDVFLDKLLVTRMRYLTSRTLINNIGFVTNAGNAGVFDDDDLRNIVAPCSRINISVYGLDEEETEAMTRRRGFYLKALPQYQRILATRSKYTKIGFSFRLLKPDANERAVRWMLDNFGQVYGHEVLTAFGNWAGAIDTQDPLPFSGVWRSPGEASENETPCAYPVLHIKVAVNGDVKFCSCVDYDSNPENIIGNVRDDNLLAIYNGHRAASLWRHGLSMCVGCTHRVDIPMITSQYAKLSSVISELGV
jgi:MoaA/NifB/PqqE/SkfB family radical SAM enzyme